jgi:tRNA threonylcarbamoyladenosine biosynthesis protein TsaB
MAFLLHIDTSMEIASICFSRDGELLELAKNGDPKNHSSWLHSAIKKLSENNSFHLEELDGISVTIGPGSYTGLRVGLSAAKGLCFALNKPLVAVGTLEMMANGIRNKFDGLICPMIDARRMEVFTAVYNQSMQPIVKPTAMIVDKESFSDLLTHHSIVFTGSGSQKLKNLILDPNAVFVDGIFTANDMITVAEKNYNEGKLADLAYTEPMYLKEFYFPQ